MRARLSGAKLILGKEMSHEAFQNVARLQAAALIGQLKREQETMSSDDAVFVAEELTSLNLPPDIRDEVLIVVVGADTKRRKQQNYESFLSFMPDYLWGRLMSTSVSAVAKEEALCLFLIMLGCVNPSESTSKLATSLILLLCIGLDKAMDKSSYEKGKSKETLHATLKRLVRNGARRVFPYLTKLHSSPTELKAEFSDLYRQIFENEPPVSIRIDQSMLAQVNGTYGCRNNLDTLRRSQSSTAIVSAHGTEDASLSSAMMQTMMNMQRMMMMGMDSQSRGSRDGDMADLITFTTPPRQNLRAPVALPHMPPSPITSAENVGIVLHPPENTVVGQIIATPKSTSVQAIPELPTSDAPDTESFTDKLRLALKAKHEVMCKRPAAASETDDDSAEIDAGDEPHTEAEDVVMKKPSANAKTAKTKALKAIGKAKTAKDELGKKTKALARVSKPSFSVEWSRCQVLCRSGLRGPKQSTSLRFGPGQTYKSVDAAKVAATKWLTKERRIPVICVATLCFVFHIYCICSHI